MSKKEPTGRRKRVAESQAIVDAAKARWLLYQQTYRPPIGFAAGLGTLAAAQAGFISGVHSVSMGEPMRPDRIIELKPKRINCINCGAPLDVHNFTRSASCTYCLTEYST